MNNKKIVSWLLLLALTACGSKVSLVDPPTVEDRGSIQAKDRQPAPPTPPSQPEPQRQRDITTVTALPIDTGSDANTIYFDYDSYVVKPEFQHIVASQAKRLASSRSIQIVLAGHTDDQGGREYNLALGQKRAEAVKRALTLLGANEAQLEAVSFGKEKLAANGTDDVSRAKNRRVEFSNR